MDKAYPRPISNWEGVPDDIDAALRYENGYTYFFKQGQYYRFDDMKFKVNNEEQCVAMSYMYFILVYRLNIYLG